MKQVKDFVITENLRLNPDYSRLRVSPADSNPLPAMEPGQFVEIQVPAQGVFLRRPISINDVNFETNTLDLLIRRAGHGTESLISMHEGETLNIMLPLGNGFSYDYDETKKILLVGGGVGCAPLLYLGRKLRERNVKVEFLIGARSAKDLLLIDEFTKVGAVHITTEDGTEGIKGFVTIHPALTEQPLDLICCCGPMPMMKAVAKIAQEREIECEVSLENVMACGLGACLCCVEDTAEGHVCVCTEGPVFNTHKLKW